MSTAGKVLVVLVTLMILVWILLVSKVADLNRNWGAAVDKLDKQYAKQQEELAAIRLSLTRTKAEIAREQDTTTKAVMALRRDLSLFEKASTEVQEALTRAKYQLASVQGQAKAAEAELAFRVQEKADETQKVADLNKQVQTLKAQNDALATEKKKLGDEFAKTLAENKDLLKRISGAGRGSTVKPATLAR
jgi:chromosome segregation ATPase